MIYWIWLSRLQEIIGYNEISNLMKKYKTPERIWKSSKSELYYNGVKENIIKQIQNIEYKKNLEKYEKYMEKYKISIITRDSEQYPQSLKNIYDSPFVLYIKGDVENLNKFSIGMVGSRNCSDYGRKVALQLSYNLSKKGVIIVSGLARGIDTFSHIGCINAHKSTIAVVANGLDTVYPKENEKLYYEIIKTGGAVVSEYLIGTKPEKKNFPARNRIISGITNGLILIEASNKSGAIITADFSLEQGKNVFCVPGNITSFFSQGTNNLIKEGAKIVTCVEDILEEY